MIDNMMTKEKLIKIYNDTITSQFGKNVMEVINNDNLTYITFLNRLLIDIGVKNNFFFKGIYKSKSTFIKKRKIIIDLIETYGKNNTAIPNSILLPLIDTFTNKDLSTIEDTYKTHLLFSPKDFSYEKMKYYVETFDYSIDDINKSIVFYLNFLNSDFDIYTFYKNLVNLSDTYFTTEEQEKFIDNNILLLKEKIISLYKIHFLSLNLMALRELKNWLNMNKSYALFNSLHYLFEHSNSNKNEVESKEREFLSLLLKPIIYSSNARAIINIFAEDSVLNGFGEMKQQALSILFEIEGFKKEYIKSKIE